MDEVLASRDLSLEEHDQPACTVPNTAEPSNAYSPIGHGAVTLLCVPRQARLGSPLKECDT